MKSTFCNFKLIIIFKKVTFIKRFKEICSFSDVETQKQDYTVLLSLGTCRGLVPGYPQIPRSTDAYTKWQSTYI